MSELEKPQCKIICVCDKCGHHDSEATTIEINFKEKKIYHMCPKCESQNDISIIPPPTYQPYPKSKRL